MSKADRIDKFYSRDLFVRAAVARTTDLVQTIQDFQSTTPVATIALGRAVTGALLMASHLREGQKVSFEFRGDGPLGGLYAEGSFEGEARGYVSNPQAIAVSSDGRPDVGAGVGKGTLSVTRSQPFEKAPHTGIVPLQSGQIGEDLAFYYLQSYQVPSVVALSVSLDEHGEVKDAGGLILEVMPGAPPTLLDELTKRAQNAPALSEQLHSDDSLETIVQRYFHAVPLTTVPHPHPVKFACKCTRERVERSLRLLGKDAVQELRDRGESSEITCQFCGRRYTVTVAELDVLLKDL